ncbi:hypothetical protein DCC85_21650 [Paenibacillus sp. CAA11]|uniref:serine hydrolase domain-containing protein n=1 Tax=Paenibacillus sp. CAA11 TaxID=1532905 RepID=UPI000D3BF0D9|nr:serine hydrolase domain-containing protein [Paenibacillus sp. CAA11]AWB46515.1 hypothetical protein DCC85_21650 [Paenibacillus sp. CAA11]
MNMKRYYKLAVAVMSILLLTLFTVPAALPVSAKTAGSSQDGELTPSGIPYTELGQQIDALVGTYIAKSSPGAAVVITRGDKIIFSKGYGFANVEKKTPVDPGATIFEYGSINKLFVWTSVMQLVEEGKIKLDEDIREYLPDPFVKKLRYDKPITMLDLMSHTAGFEQHPSPLFIKSPEHLESLEQALLSSQPKQIYEPGKVIAYSNFGTALAGYVVESLSGQPFSEYEMNQILLPLGMNHTSGHPASADRPELLSAEATGYAMAEEGGFDTREKYYTPLYPAGGMRGTAEDLARFAMALTAPDSPLFAKPQTLQTFLKPSYTVHEDVPSNAHGFWQYSAKPYAVGHGGNVMGFSGDFAVVPEERLGIIVLTNTEVEPVITAGVMNLMLGSQAKEPGAQPPASGMVPSSQIAGDYVLAQSTYSTVHEFLNYKDAITIQAKGEHDLTLSYMELTGDYKQVSPSIFMPDSSTSPVFQKLAPILYAEMANDKVVRLSKGKATDLLPVKPSRSSGALTAYKVGAGVTAVFFGLALLGMPLSWLVRKRKGAAVSRASSGLFAGGVLCASALILNVLLMLSRLKSNPEFSIGQLNFEIILNWILVVLAGLLWIGSLLIRSQVKLSMAHKVFRIAAVLLLGGFVVLIADWHFFHLIV